MNISVKAEGHCLNVIEISDGELVTKRKVVKGLLKDGKVVSDKNNDVLKVVVLDRYTNSAPAVGFVHNFGLKKGAVASTFAHDSHNIIAAGVNDEFICLVTNKLIAVNGGITLTDEQDLFTLPCLYFSINLTITDFGTVLL